VPIEAVRVAYRTERQDAMNRRMPSGGTVDAVFCLPDLLTNTRLHDRDDGSESAGAVAA
jgi:hypothetical protein